MQTYCEFAQAGYGRSTAAGRVLLLNGLNPLACEVMLYSQCLRRSGTIEAASSLGERFPVSWTPIQRFTNEHSTDLAMDEMDAMDAVDENAV